MKPEQVDQALRQKFLDQKERLVFWHDQDGEFTDYIAEGLQGELSAVALVEPAKLGGLSTKLLLEQEKPKKQFLIYTTGAPHPAKEDWLYDIRLYSAKFHADIASIWLQELGLAQLSLHDHLKSRATFLNNKERRKKLAHLVVGDDDAVALDRKMIAVLVKATADTPFSILQTLCHDHVEAGRYDLDTEPDTLKNLEKMDLLESFWKMMIGLFDYKAESPSISGLLRCLFYSELSSQLGPSMPPALQHYRLSTSGTSNALGFLSQWMDSKTTAASHDAVALAIWCEGQLGELLSGLNLSTLENVFTFWGIEKLIISKIKAQLLDDALPVEAEALAALVAKRRGGTG